MTKAALFALFSALFAIPHAHAINGAGLEIGHGNDSTELARVSARWDWDKRWSVSDGWIASGFWEAGLARWDGGGIGPENLWDVSLTPVFRLRSGISKFYLEGAIGAHVLSKTHINSRRAFGTSLQFGDHVGFGWNFGDRDRYELGYRLQHVSNAGLKEPNNGINFHTIRFGYNY